MDHLAKTNPRETIQEHTENLLRNLAILRKLYPNLKVNWELLYYACLYHDLGKMNPKFRMKLENGKKVEGEIPHNILSLPFINITYLEEEGFSDREISLLFHAVAYHHNRSTDFSDEEIKREIELMRKELDEFIYEPFEKIKFLEEEIDADFFMLNERIYENNPDFYQYVMLKGLLNRLDYAASAHIDVEIENDFLEKSMNVLLDILKDKHGIENWNELQKFMIQNRENNTITIAQTGMGKTEAGLLWIGNHKGFFTLPLKTAINEIYKRITNTIVEKRENVGLLHSDTFSKYLEEEAEIEDVQEYYNKTKQLSLPLTVCTLDQLFDFVYRYRDFESKLATLAYSKVVIDEIQMYSPNLLAYLIFGLEYITKIGGKFAILTATFPPFIENKLRERKIEFQKSEKPFIYNDMVRHSIKIIETQLNVDKVIEKFSNNKILIVCNTVKKAQDIYDQLCNCKEIREEYINLIHSKFTKGDRAKKEKEIMSLGNSENKGFGIWIGTQIVEASLDIDFDLLFTELSDINGLLQRLGRCYRKRRYEGSDYNCYVYVGDTYPCSGISAREHSIIDIDIFKNSKKALIEQKINGSFTEEKKLKLIDEVYSMEKIKTTKYYKTFENTLDYLKIIDPYELSKNESKKRFRNILNTNIIPKPVYEENYNEIKVLLNVINREIKLEENYQERKKIRYQSMDKLTSFMVSVSYSEVRSSIRENEAILIGRYEKAYIINCQYSYEKGVIIKKDQSQKEKANNENFDSQTCFIKGC